MTASVAKPLAVTPQKPGVGLKTYAYELDRTTHQLAKAVGSSEVQVVKLDYHPLPT